MEGLTSLLREVSPLSLSLMVLIYLVPVIVIGLLVSRWKKVAREVVEEGLDSISALCLSMSANINDHVERLSKVAQDLAKVCDTIDKHASMAVGGYEMVRRSLAKGGDALQIAKRFGIGLGEVELVSTLMELEDDKGAKAEPQPHAM
ncbi:MAG TPA: hypothetical protein EYP53_05440 [Candidatus Latescibacteria bacterium]|nr:hypothetical protein [Candidatus Latescibacterota bacterium]